MSAARLDQLAWEAHDGVPEAEGRVVDRGLGEANDAAAPLHEVQGLSCFARAPSGEVVGGAVGRTWGASCELQQLWVAPGWRRSGVGSRLVRLFEERAAGRGCGLFYLETLSFQAPDFYRALGYEVRHAIRVLPYGVVRYLMVRGSEPALVAEAIACEVRVRASPEAAWDAIATAAGLDAWFTSGAAVDARPGGAIRLRWKDWGPARITDEDGGPVLEARRGERFVFQWSPDGPGYRTTVAIDFERAPEGTIVRLREHGFRDTPSGRRRMLDCAAGWGEALALLKFHLEHGLRY